MKFFVLGCNGMAGHMVTLYLKEQKYDVVGFARTPSRFVQTITGDAFDTDLVKRSISEGDFDIVVNCIGILNNFAENNKDVAVFLNSYFPHFLVKATESSKAKIIHISTDCVFSGKSGGYTETSFRDAESFYGRSKALGEIEDDKNLTIRTSIIGPDIKESGIGLFNWFMKQKGEINGFVKAMWTGQTTLQLAKTIEQASIMNAHGLVNLIPKESISKYTLLKLLNHYFRNDSIIINPKEDVVVDKSLVRTNHDMNYEIPDYETMIQELSTWMQSHKALYPHYIF